MRLRPDSFLRSLAQYKFYLYFVNKVWRYVYNRFDRMYERDRPTQRYTAWRLRPRLMQPSRGKKHDSWSAFYSSDDILIKLRVDMDLKRGIQLFRTCLPGTILRRLRRSL